MNAVRSMLVFRHHLLTKSDAIISRHGLDMCLFSSAASVFSVLKSAAFAALHHRIDLDQTQVDSSSRRSSVATTSAEPCTLLCKIMARLITAALAFASVSQALQYVILSV